MTNLYKKAGKCLLALLLVGSAAANAQTSTFDTLALAPNSYWNGAGPVVTGTFSSGKATFDNSYATSYGGYWQDGWIYSNKTDSGTVGYTNIASARAGSGAGNSKNYAIGTQYSRCTMVNADTVRSIGYTNTTYAALSMANGDTYAKKFGGVSGNDPDYFKLVVYGYDGNVKKPDSVEIYLADYRDANNANDYIVKDWRTADLKKLGKVTELDFVLRSSDAGQFGINTPLYFAIDNVVFPNTADSVTFENLTLGPDSYWKGRSTTLSAAIEGINADFANYYSTSGYGDYWSGGFALSNKTDSATAGYTNQYSAITANGYNGSVNYLVGQGGAIARLVNEAKGKPAAGFYVTNSTYAYKSMQAGDFFAKKFGGATGNDPDFFKVVVYGYLNSAIRKADSVECYLADYRNTDNSKDYILKDWKYVDLQKLGNVDSLEFVLRSSDVGQFGMNTPAYFCLDNFSTLKTTVGIESNASQSLAMFPNPVNTALSIRAENTLFEHAQVRLFDVNGNQVLAGNLNGNAVLNTEALAQGVYLLQMKAANGVVLTHRIVKQ